MGCTDTVPDYWVSKLPNNRHSYTTKGNCVNVLQLWNSSFHFGTWTRILTTATQCVTIELRRPYYYLEILQQEKKTLCLKIFHIWLWVSQNGWSYFLAICKPHQFTILLFNRFWYTLKDRQVGSGKFRQASLQCILNFHPFLLFIIFISLSLFFHLRFFMYLCMCLYFIIYPDLSLLQLSLFKGESFLKLGSRSND